MKTAKKIALFVLRLFVMLWGNSKKARAMIAGVLLVSLQPLLKKIDMQLTGDQLVYAVGIVVAYLGSVAAADAGKERAKVEAEKMPVPKFMLDADSSGE